VAKKKIKNRIRLQALKLQARVGPPKKVQGSKDKKELTRIRGYYRMKKTNKGERT
jgi:hypothetical protein